PGHADLRRPVARRGSRPVAGREPASTNQVRLHAIAARSAGVRQADQAEGSELRRSDTLGQGGLGQPRSRAYLAADGYPTEPAAPEDSRRWQTASNGRATSSWDGCSAPAGPEVTCEQRLDHLDR